MVEAVAVAFSMTWPDEAVQDVQDGEQARGLLAAFRAGLFRCFGKYCSTALRILMAGAGKRRWGCRCGYSGRAAGGLLVGGGALPTGRGVAGLYPGAGAGTVGVVGCGAALPLSFWRSALGEDRWVWGAPEPSGLRTSSKVHPKGLGVNGRQEKELHA